MCARLKRKKSQSPGEVIVKNFEVGGGGGAEFPHHVNYLAAIL